ncbi:hypothetical protein SEA_VETRIX_109 [Mycobacterium phage Vetrix]|nr:hypothetical protein SEA_VETRIX_109 [Mycobacterium phage Vetrix]
MTTSRDPYEGKVRIGRIVRDAAKAAVHDEARIPEVARVNDILAAEVFINALAEAGCMITRIPTKPKPVEYPIECVCGESISPDTPYVEEDVRPGVLWHGNAEGGGHKSNAGVRNG